MKSINKYQIIYKNYYIKNNIYSNKKQNSPSLLIIIKCQ
jgi:hypothetical protein